MNEQKKLKASVTLGPEQDADFAEALTLIEECKLLMSSCEEDVTDILGEIDN
jgi:hypothetical protein